MKDDNEVQCASCLKLWDRIDRLEKEKRKSDKQAAWQLVASGVLLGMLLCNLAMSLLRS